MTAVCRVQYVLPEVKDCTQASRISITVWKAKGKEETDTRTPPQQTALLKMLIKSRG